MVGCFSGFFSFLFRRRSVVTLAIVWMFGLLLGTIAAVASGDSYFLLMRTAASSRVSIAGLAASALLPFLFSAFAVYIGKPKLLHLVCFVKAFLFAQGAFGAVAAFGSAGWLARFLLQFSDILLIPVLCWFSVRHISDSGYSLKRDSIVCSAAWILVGSLDYCVVSPFLAMLIDI